MKDIVVSNSYNSSEKSVFGNALFSFPSTKYLLKDIINEYFSMNIRDISLGQLRVYAFRLIDVFVSLYYRSDTSILNALDDTEYASLTLHIMALIKISHTTSTANSTQDEYDLIKSYIEDDIFQEHCFRRLFRIIIIDGPKTSGRSALSDSLAKKYETPIITVPSTTTDNDKENNKRVDSMFIAQREFATENYMAYYMMQRSCIESYEELINTMFEKGHVVW